MSRLPGTSIHSLRALLAAAMLLGLMLPAIAQRRLIVAVMPTQYFAADAESAAHLTDGLLAEFGQQGYILLPSDCTKAVASAMELRSDRHYADAVPLEFGKRLQADLVVYPRLLALAPSPSDGTGEKKLRGSALILLRVLNVHTRRAIYAQQLRYEFEDEPGADCHAFRLGRPHGRAAAELSLKGYWRSVRFEEWRGTYRMAR
jgi:hypothetical protein